MARLKSTSKRGYRDMHQLHVGSGEHLRVYATEVGAFGPKKAGFREVLSYHRVTCIQGPLRHDSAHVWQRVIVLASSTNTSFAQVRRETRTDFSSSLSAWASPSRRVVEKIGGHFDDSELLSLARSDVFWDEVMEIEELGDEPVFDATVPETHNFLVEGIVLENSIEQDSDLVMLLYRDEVYNRDTEAHGEAELILSKHRNGPTGTVRLAFMNQYTKFASIAKGPNG